MEYQDVKREVAIANRILAFIGVTGNSVSAGHASSRVPDSPDLFVVKGRGYGIDALPVMRAQDMITCDLDGNKVEGGPAGSCQCHEVKIHSAIYKNYPDVASVVHVHPTYSILMGILGAHIVPMSNGGGRLVERGVPTWPHSRLVLTDEDGEGLAKLLAHSRAALMKGHGAVTTGASLAEAIMAIHGLEEQAKMNYLACVAMGTDHPRLPQELLDEAREQPRWWELPHFRSGGATSEPVGSQSGSYSYRYWSSLVEGGV